MIKFRSSIATLTASDKSEVTRLFRLFQAECGPVDAAKGLGILCPAFFPMWDNDIAKSYGVSVDDNGYFEFMEIIKGQISNLPEEILPGLTSLKSRDEFNYLRAPRKSKGDSASRS